MEQSARTHVLVVDDEEGIRDMFKDHLEERGYICHTAPSGHAALEVLGTEPVELALVDIIMPGMTGITLFEHMKDRYPDVAVIFVTAVDDLNIAVAYLRDGAYDYMVKPVGRNQFHQRVEGALAKCKAMTEGRQHRRLLEEQVARQAVELETRVRELEDLNRVFQQDLADISPNGRAESPESPSLKERQLQRSIMCLQESVKKRISEYLHGHVQSKLLVLQYKLGQCQEVVSQDPEGASTLLNEMRADLQSIQENDIRQASHELLPRHCQSGVGPGPQEPPGPFPDGDPDRAERGGGDNEPGGA